MTKNQFKNLLPGDLIQSRQETWLVLEEPVAYELSHNADLIILVQVVDSILYSVSYDDRIWVNFQATKFFKVVSRS